MILTFINYKITVFRMFLYEKILVCYAIPIFNNFFLNSDTSSKCRRWSS